jgi:hypothetical protein
MPVVVLSPHRVGGEAYPAEVAMAGLDRKTCPVRRPGDLSWPAASCQRRHKVGNA